MDKPLEKFKNDVAYLGEHYPDYVIIVKARDTRVFWKSSDRIWSSGAMMRYQRFIDETDREEDLNRMADNG